MAWIEHLTDQERGRLAQIEGQRRSLTAEYRRIYDRCRKRMKKGKGGRNAESPE